MKPPKSLMAFVLAVSLAAPVLGAAQWTSFQAGGRPYFAHVDARDAFYKTPPVVNSVDLYDSPSDQTPSATLKRDDQGMVMIQRNGDANVLMPSKEELDRMPKTPIVPPAKPATQRTAATTTGSGDPEIDAIVTAAGASVKPADLFAMLSSLKSNDPATFALVKAAAADKTKKAAVAHLLETAAVIPDKVNDAWQFLSSNTRLALGIASAPSPTSSGGVPGVGGVSGRDAGGDNANLGINPIAQAIVGGQPAQARKDASDALVAFLSDADQKYVSDEVRSAQGDASKGQKTQLDGVVAAFRALLDTQYQKPETANGVGVLYAALIAGQPAPAWVPDDKKPPVADFLAAVKSAKPVFIAAMKPWTPAGAKPTDECKSAGPWKGGSAGSGETSGGNTTLDAWMAAFLACAEQQALSALNKAHVPKDVADRIAQQLGADWINPPGVRPPTNPNGGNAGINLNFTAAGFTTKELYRDGAVVHTMQMTLDGDPPRDITVEIALKLSFRQEGGQMVPELGVFDVSNDGSNGRTTHVYGQFFDLGQIPGAAQDLRLESSPDSYYDKDKYPIHYQISRDPDKGTISFGVDGQMKTVQQSELYGALQSQIEQAGHTVEVNGHRFQVIGQGGKGAQMLFFEAQDTSLVNGGAQLAPSLISGTLNSISVNKSTHFPTESVKTGDRQLGYIGYSASDPTKKQYYALTWNDAKGYFEIVPKDAPVPDDAPPSTGGDDNNNTDDNNSTDDNNNNTPDANNNNAAPAGNNNTRRRGRSNDTSKPTDKSSSADCSTKNAFDSGNTPADFGNWHYWTGPAGDTYYCFFGDKYLHAGGYLAKIEETKDEVLVTTIFATKGQTAGITKLDVDKISDGHETATITKTGRTVDLEIGNVFVYHLALAALKSRPRSNQAAQIDNVAWLTDVRTGNDPSKRASLKVLFEADAKKRAAAAVAIIAGYSADDSGIFGGDQGKANRGKLLAFLNAMIDKDTGSLKLDSPPNALITLNLTTDAVRQSGGDVAVYTDRQNSAAGLPWVVPNQGDPYLGDWK